MAKIFAIRYIIYFEAADLHTANRFGKLFGSKLTYAMRKSALVEDKTSVVIPASEAREVTETEHKLALDFQPHPKYWDTLSKQVIEFLNFRD